MTKPILVALLALPSLLGPAVLSAQTPGHELAILELPSSTAAMAEGGAFDLSSEDSDGIFYNPATLVPATGLVLGLQRFGDVASQVTLSAATDWWDGGVGLGLQVLEWGAAPDRMTAGGVDRLLADGPLATTEWVASAGYAREILGPSVGVVAKLVGRRIGSERHVEPALDLGIAHDLGPIRVGLAVRNLTADLEPSDAARAAGDVVAEPDPVPERITLGAAFSGYELGPLDLGSAARLTRRADGDLEAGGGLEVAYWPVTGRTFIGRVGIQTVPDGGASSLTFGAAFHGDALVLEYAYRPVDAFGSEEGLHRVSIGWR